MDPKYPALSKKDYVAMATKMETDTKLDF